MKITSIVLFTVIGAAATATAGADGLVPCDNHGAGFAKDLSEDSHDSRPGELILSYIYTPSLRVGWGLQIFRSENRYFLRSLQFRRDFHGGMVEIRPHVFGSNPVQPDPVIRMVALSGRLAEALRAVSVAEIAQADRANARMGLDGEGYYFDAEGRCAFAWSPDTGSRSARLSNIFDTLNTQSRLPTRPLQLLWEGHAVVRLNHFTGSATMPASDYLVFIAAGVAVVVVGALPLLTAGIVTLIPTRPHRKLRFVLIAGALSYGFTCIIAVALLPFFLIGSQAAAQLDVDGHSVLAPTLDAIVEYSVYVVLNALLVFAVAVPIYLRKKWPTLFVARVPRQEI
jgi:hypothetical protein